MAEDFTMLACGRPTSETELGKLQVHISTNLDHVCAQIVKLKEQPDGIATLYGPFLGRSALELAMHGILARVDPFRMMAVREMQKQPSFEISKRRKASVQWHGDILSNDPPPKDMWSSDIGVEKLTRALLGDYVDQLFWRSAFTSLLDAVPPGEGGAWMDELRRLDPDKFILRIRSEASGLFSSLSKGLHHEFLLAPGALYDRKTVSVLIQDVLRVASHLALVSHMLSHCPFGVGSVDAIKAYSKTQAMEVV